MPACAGMTGACAGMTCTAARAAEALPPSAGVQSPVADGAYSALLAGGPQAAQWIDLWRLMLGVTSAVFVAILITFAFALMRARRGDRDTPPDLSSLDRPERGAKLSVAWAVGVSSVLLVGLIGASVATDRTLSQLDLRDALHVEVTAHQWWWEFRYDDTDPSRIFTSANEMHIPAGRAVIVTLKADDVIHSFWVPSLAGKKDLIPGRSTTLRLRADVPGSYRGQCAEFCGAQHAWMAFYVLADAPDRYAAWADQQRASAAEPAPGSVQAKGKQVFMGSTCVMCHSINGTEASAVHAPDLTHLAGRRMLGAGVLPNTREHLASWISDPQAHKPGVNMPAHAFTPGQLDALVAYLQSLQ
jgi:cytochrome c oxidase subunit II